MINTSRLAEHIEELSKIGRNVDTNGINRFSYTEEEQEANLLVTQYMEAAGLEVSYDDIGNLIGSIGPADKETIMLGSHIDTVPDGGKFDGALGVLIAIEIVQTLNENNIDLNYQIKVVSFKDEEGTRFNFGLIGSKAMSGILTSDDLNNTDAQDITLKEAIQTQGYSYQNLYNNIQDNIKAYIECHIEQGRVLETNGLPIGIVTGIAGPLWIEVEVEGKSEHAGATPMDQRYDALAAASEMILSIENSVQHSKNIVATVGKMNIHPNGVNVIPGKVKFTIDIRSISETDISKLEETVLHQLQQIAQKRNTNFSYKILQRVKPAKTDSSLQKQLAKSIKKHQIEPFYLMSGAGHDAMNIERIAPITMLFVRSKDGVSHSPSEYSSQYDINIAANVLYDFVKSIL